MPEPIPTIGLLGMAYKLLSARVFEAVRPHAPGLRPAHGNVMEQLDIEDGQRLTDLARGAAMTPQSLGELVDQLEELGYVERRADPDDRRAKRVYLTARGRPLRKHSRAAIAAVEADLEGVLGSRGYAALQRSLVRLLEAEAGGEP